MTPTLLPTIRRTIRNTLGDALQRRPRGRCVAAAWGRRLRHDGAVRHRLGSRGHGGLWALHARRKPQGCHHR